MDSLLSTLQQVAQRLESTNVQFALAGGLVASLYRDQPRATNDLDICVVSKGAAKAIEVGQKILEDMGFEVGKAKATDLQRRPQMNKKQSPVVMLVGRQQKGNVVGVDFLLATMPWVEEAVDRAQSFKIDYGCGLIPTLTLEDFILSKIFSVKDNPSRYKDLDDLQSIFLNSKITFDETYLASRFIRYKLSFPKELEREVPEFLKVISKKNRS